MIEFAIALTVVSVLVLTGVSFVFLTLWSFVRDVFNEI